MRRSFSSMLFALSCGAALFVPARPVRAAGLLANLIDTPTAEVVDHYGYSLNFRLYSGGGVLTKTAFGVLPRLNVGFGLDAEQFIGADTVDMNRPTLNVKFRAFDGKRHLPAVAVGYDGQGYFFDDRTDEYLQREKGLFIVGSGEIIVPNLSLHGGLNMYDFSEDEVYAFTGLNYLYYEVVGLSVEVDNIHTARRNRINGGLRYYITPSVSVDLAARDLFAAGRKSERVILIGYFGSF
jgi:hypothetical protein